MMHTWKKFIAAAFLGSALLLPLGMTSAKEAMVGMPNPLVEYSSYSELNDAVHFRPLALPKGTVLAGKYKPSAYISISGETADVRYDLEKGGSLMIRSAKVGKGSQDISGIYTKNWKEQNFDGTTVSVAKVQKNCYAARWKVGDYTFAVYGEKMKEKDFKKLLPALVDYTEQHYGDSVNPMARYKR